MFTRRLESVNPTVRPVPSGWDHANRTGPLDPNSSGARPGRAHFQIAIAKGGVVWLGRPVGWLDRAPSQRPGRTGSVGRLPTHAPTRRAPPSAPPDRKWLPVDRDSRQTSPPTRTGQGRRPVAEKHRRHGQDRPHGHVPAGVAGFIPLARTKQPGTLSRRPATTCGHPSRGCAARSTTKRSEPSDVRGSRPRTASAGAQPAARGVDVADAEEHRPAG